MIVDLFRDLSPDLHALYQELFGPRLPTLNWVARSYNLVNLRNSAEFPKLDPTLQDYVEDRIRRQEELPGMPMVLNWHSCREQGDGWIENELWFAPEIIEHVGCFLWDWQAQESLALTLDIDADAVHGKGLPAEKLEQVLEQMAHGPLYGWKSKSATGFHYIAPFKTPVAARDRKEHGIINRATAKPLLERLGVSIRSVDCFGSNLWGASRSAKDGSFNPFQIGEPIDQPGEDALEAARRKADNRDRRQRKKINYENASDKQRAFIDALDIVYCETLSDGTHLIRTHSTCVAEVCKVHGIAFEPHSNSIGDGKPNCSLFYRKDGFYVHFLGGEGRKDLNQEIRLTEPKQSTMREVTEDVLRDLRKDFTFGNTEAGQHLAVNGEAYYDLDSSRFESYVGHRCNRDYEITPSVSMIRNITNVVSHDCRNGETYKLCKRVIDTDRYHYHLGDGQCVVIDEGLRIEQPNDLLFAGIRPSYEPDLDNGSIEPLRKYCPMLDERSYALLVAFIVGARWI